MAILCGTSGFDYPEWVGAGRFYPPGLSGRRSEWLTYYASQFPLVELNFTYYGETKPQQLESMLRRVDQQRCVSLIEGDFAPLPGFMFTIKSYASLTHEIAADWRTAAARLQADIAPLRESGRLLGVLAQFPSRYRVSPEALRYVCELAQTLAPTALIAEFRHRDWLCEKPRELLLQHGIVPCGVDAPQAAAMPSVFDADETQLPVCGGTGLYTGLRDQRQATPGGQDQPPPFRYLRLHGRNEQNWWGGNAASRYDYSYSPAQLKKLAQRLVQNSLEHSYALFNNHRHGKAAHNARLLAEIIAGLDQARVPQSKPAGT